MTQSRTRLLIGILTIIAIAGVVGTFTQHHRATKSEAQSASRLDAANAFRKERDNTDHMLQETYIKLGKYRPEYAFMAKDDFVPAGLEYDVARIAQQIEYYADPLAIPLKMSWQEAQAKVASLKADYLKAILKHNNGFGHAGQIDPSTYNAVPPSGLGAVKLHGVTYHLDYANLDGLAGVLVSK